MITYFVVITLVIIFSYLAEKSCVTINNGDTLLRKTSDTKVFLFIIVAILIAVSGLRYHVGTDYKAYISLYENQYSRMEFGELLNFDEPILPIIGNISYHLFDSSYAMFFITSLFTIGLILYSTYKETEDFLFVTLLYIFTGGWLGTFNGIRQYIAVAITYAGRKYILERKFFKFLLVCFIAFLAHKSALFFLLVYFVYSEKFNLKKLFLVVLATIIVSRSYEVIFNFIGWINDADGTGELIPYATKSVNILRILVGCAPAILGVYLAYKKKLDKQQIFYVYMFVCNAAVRIATADSAYLARLGAYTGVLIPLGLSAVLKSCNKKNYNILRVGIVLLYFLFWLYEVLNTKTLREFEWIFGNI